MRRLRRTVRRALVLILGLLLRATSRRAGIVLVYHVLDERQGDPARELVPPHSLPVFQDHLRHLASRYRLVEAEHILAAVAERRRWQRFPIAITFDDDLPSHPSLAVPALRRAGLPATFFLCGASLEHPFSFWWDRLQRAADLGLPLPVGGGSVRDVAARMETMPREERDTVAERLAETLGPDPEHSGLRAEGARELASAGFDIGFHTRRHDLLLTLDDRDLADALAEGREVLESVVERRLELLAYPHGKADDRVAGAARVAGFRLAFTGRQVPVGPSTDPLLIGRIEPSYGSAADFAAQLVRVLASAAHS